MIYLNVANTCTWTGKHFVCWDFLFKLSHIPISSKMTCLGNRKSRIKHASSKVSNTLERSRKCRSLVNILRESSSTAHISSIIFSNSEFGSTTAIFLGHNEYFFIIATLQSVNFPANFAREMCWRMANYLLENTEF